MEFGAWGSPVCLASTGCATPLSQLLIAVHAAWWPSLVRRSRESSMWFGLSERTFPHTIWGVPAVS